MTDMEDILKKTVIDNHAPSVQYYLFDQLNIIKSFRYGLADISGNTLLSDKTTYNAFSVTKTFTALAVMQLAERKILDIEQPVQVYLSDFPYGAEITIRQLLTHSAGIPNPIPLNWIHLPAEHAAFDRDAYFKGIISKYSKAKSGTNQRFAYSNLGYILLGQLIEKVTGMKYEQYITGHIIQRLGLQKEDLGFEIADPARQAKGYHKNISFTNLILGFFIDKSKFMGKAEGMWKPFNHFYVNGTAYGGLIGTPRAFVTYIQALLEPNNSLLSADYRNMLFTENHTANGKATGMCLSWFSGRLNGHPYFAHAGGGGGYYCEIRIYPEARLGSVVFFNRTGMTDERFLDTIDQVYLNSLSR